MRRAEIPRDIFFSDEADDDDNDDQQPEQTPDAEPEPSETDAGGEEGDAPEENDEGSQKTEKLQVSVYLTKPTARKLDAVRFQLQYDHDVKLSKSDLAEFAISRLDRNIDEIIEAAENGAFDW